MTPPPHMPDQVVIISDYARERGGASRLAMLLAETLQGRDVPVTVFSGDRQETDIPTDIDFAGISGGSLLEQRKTSAALRGIWNGSAREALASHIRRNDTPRTIYHVHGFLQTLSPAIFSALGPVRQRVAIHAHDYFLACPNGAFFDYRSRSECSRTPLSAACALRNCDKRNYAQKLWRLVRQAAQNSATRDFLADARIILIHADMRAYLERGGRRIAEPRTIRNPAQPFLPAPARPAANQAFLFVGDIHAYKGVFELAEAARQARVPIWFVGEGQDRTELQNLYPEFHYTGWQNRAGLSRLAGQARAIVVPTLGPEPFGLTIVEALACGLPVIVSDRALLASEVKETGAGQLFTAGDVDDLASVLSRVAADDILTQQMSQRALAAQQQFGKSPDQWCDEIMNLYSSMLCENHSEMPIATGEQSGLRAAPV